MAEREKDNLTKVENQRLEAIYKGLDFKKNKEEYPNTTWDSLNEELDSPFANGESLRCAVKSFQASLRNPDGEEEHEDALPRASSDEEKLREIEKARVKARDERLQYREYVRNVARQETFGEIAERCTKEIAKKKPFLKPTTRLVEGERCGISQISDWHIGMDFENGVNKYNLEIAKARVNELLEKSIFYYKLHKVSKVYVVNLQDLISGWIKTRIRLENRENTIEQVMIASELVAEYLQELSKHFLVEYYSTLDNHSRLDQDKKSALKLENFVLIINWYLKTRLANNSRIKINDNEFSEDISSFEVLGHNVVAAHGDLDKPSDAVKNMTLLTKKFYQICLLAHRHHLFVEEDNECVVIANGSLIGVDNFSESLRLTSRPLQNIIIVSKDNPVECVYPIALNLYK